MANKYHPAEHADVVVMPFGQKNTLAEGQLSMAVHADNISCTPLSFRRLIRY